MAISTLHEFLPPKIIPLWQLALLLSYSTYSELNWMQISVGDFERVKKRKKPDFLHKYFFYLDKIICTFAHKKRLQIYHWQKGLNFFFYRLLLSWKGGSLQTLIIIITVFIIVISHMWYVHKKMHMHKVHFTFEHCLYIFLFIMHVCLRRRIMHVARMQLPRDFFIITL